VRAWPSKTGTALSGTQRVRRIVFPPAMGEVDGDAKRGVVRDVTTRDDHGAVWSACHWSHNEYALFVT